MFMKRSAIAALAAFVLSLTGYEALAGSVTPSSAPLQEQAAVESNSALTLIRGGHGGGHGGGRGYGGFGARYSGGASRSYRSYNSRFVSGIRSAPRYKNLAGPRVARTSSALGPRNLTRHDRLRHRRFVRRSFFGFYWYDNYCDWPYDYDRYCYYNNY